MNSEPLLPWYVAGPLIGLTVPILLLLKEKQFGLSSSYRFLGSFIAPKTDYFIGARQNDAWQFVFAIGVLVSPLLYLALKIPVHPDTSDTQSLYGELAATIYDGSNWGYFLLAGLLVGFGARFANGCTAGHCIMGCAQFSKASIVATISFFIGGLFAAHVLIPVILKGVL